MRIGVFGGSFDPVHRGHLAAAEQATERLALHQVRFIPVRSQPLKPEGPRAAAEHRATMLQAALADHPRFVADLRELQRPGPSYTIDTLRELKVEHPADELFLLVGADAVRDLPRWREGSALGTLATIVVLPRPGGPAGPVPTGAVVLELDPIDVSATEIRRAAARGLPLGDAVPPAVARYIADHRLYDMGA